MNSVVSVQELRGFINPKTRLPYVPADMPDTYLESILDFVVEDVERTTRNRFRLYRETWRIDGSGTNLLHFPPSIPYPLVVVEGLSLLADNATVEETLIENEDFVNCGLFLKIANYGDITTRRHLSISPCCSVFSRGVKNYEITGQWGMTTPPLGIKRAVMLLSVEMILPGATGMQTQLVAQQSWPDYTVTFRGSKYDASSVMLTEYSEVDRLIKPFVNWSTLFMRGDTVAYLVSSEELSDGQQLAGTGIFVLQVDPVAPTRGMAWYNGTQRVWKFFISDGNVSVLGTPNPTVTPISPLTGAQEILTYITDPTVPYEGQLWFNATDRVFKGYNGIEVAVFGNTSPVVGLPIKSEKVLMVTIDPVAPEIGTVWFNLLENKWKMMEGTGVVIIGGGS